MKFKKIESQFGNNLATKIVFTPIVSIATIPVSIIFLGLMFFLMMIVALFAAPLATIFVPLKLVWGYELVDDDGSPFNSTLKD